MDAGVPLKKVLICVAVVLIIACAVSAYFIFRPSKHNEDGNDVNGGQNKRPTADAGQYRTVGPGEAVELNGSRSSDPDGDKLDYYWDIDAGTDSNNDGSSTNDRDLVGQIIIHTYPVPSETITYLVTLNVTDGEFFDTSTTKVTILISDNETPPSITLSCRYERPPPGTPLDPNFIITVDQVTSNESILRYSFILTSKNDSIVHEGTVQEIYGAGPNEPIRYIDIYPFTTLTTGDSIMIKEAEGVEEGGLFRLFYLEEVGPAGEVELTKGL